MSYYQGPLWPPQEPQPQSDTYGQPPYQQPQFYAQPTGGFGPPPQQPPRKKNKVKLILVIGGGILALTCALCGLAAYAGSTIKTTVAPTATPTHATLLVATATPTQVLVTQPTAAPTMKPTPTATHAAAPRPTQQPTPKPTPTHCVGVNNNPWCYDFNPGKLITNPPSNFCAYFNCIQSFWGTDDPDGGYVNECVDGTFSQSGGESGDCSHHGGEWRPLYSH